MPDGKFECSVRALDCLRPGRRISPGNQIEARALGVRHGTSIRSPRKPCQIRSVKPVVHLVAAWPSRGAPPTTRMWHSCRYHDKNVAFMSLGKARLGGRRGLRYGCESWDADLAPPLSRELGVSWNRA